MLIVHSTPGFVSIKRGRSFTPDLAVRSPRLVMTTYMLYISNAFSETVRGGTGPPERRREVFGWNVE